MWFCGKCRELVEKNIITDRKIEERCQAIMQAYENRISTLEVKIENKCDEDQVQELIKKEWKQMRQDKKQNEQTGMREKEETIKNLALESVITEMNERKTRENNIVIYGIKEAQSDVIEERKRKDTDVVIDILKTCKLKADESSISKVIRLGANKNRESTPEEGKHGGRPILVTLKNGSMKIDLFKNIRYFNTADAYKLVRIANDLTKNERENERRLREEAKKMESSASGEFRYRVRGPPWARKVVKVQKTENQLHNKLPELDVRVKENVPQIIGITEVKPKNSRFTQKISEFNLDQESVYYTFSKNIENNTGRGLLLYIDKSLPAKEVVVKTKFQEELFIEIKLNNNDTLLVGLIYRSPTLDRGSVENNELLNELINEMSNKGHTHLLLMGDFNFPGINWDTWNTRSDSLDSLEYKFIECVMGNYLHQHVNEPTRARGSDNPNILDLILTNEENMITSIDYQSPLGKSDHRVLRFNFNCYTKIPQKDKTRRRYNRADYKEINRTINETNWNELLESTNDINKTWNDFYTKLNEIEDLYIPKIMIKGNQKRHSFPLDRDTRELIKRKNALSRKAIKGDIQSQKEYKRTRNKLRNRTRFMRKSFEDRISKQANTNPKAIWKYIKSKSKTKVEIGDLYKDPNDSNSNKTDKDKEKADILADFFQSVFVKEPGGDVPTIPTYKVVHKMESLHITEETTNSKLEKLKIDKSPGIDEIHPRFLKETSTSIIVTKMGKSITASKRKRAIESNQEPKNKEIDVEISVSESDEEKVSDEVQTDEAKEYADYDSSDEEEIFESESDEEVETDDAEEEINQFSTSANFDELSGNSKPDEYADYNFSDGEEIFISESEEEVQTDEAEEDINTISTSANFDELNGNSKPDEYAEYDSSDEEDIRNTIGNVPIKWYDEYSHIGYDLDGSKIMKPTQISDQLDNFLKKMEDPDYWCTVKDYMTGKDVVLSDEDVAIIKRIQGGNYPRADHDEYKPWVDFFTHEKMIHPVTNHPPTKRSFIPSKIEKNMVSKMVHAIKMGWIKPKPKLEEPNTFFMLWDHKDEENEKINKRMQNHMPAPKMKLPGHEESYNPPSEYIFSKEEEEEWEKQDPEDRKLSYVPQKFSNLRRVPAYSDFIRERFHRCLDLYLCPRQRKMRVNVDPEDLIPQLPKPKDLQPFPTTLSVKYLGHTDFVRSITLESSGEYLASGSDDGTIRIWEVSTGRCLKVIRLGSPVKCVSWCPNPNACVIAATLGKNILIINGGIGDKLVASNTDAVLSADPAENSNQDKEEVVKWRDSSEDEYDKNTRVVIEHSHEIKSVTWHTKGDYFASVMPDGGSKSVIIHQLSKKRSQTPFKKSKGRVQNVLFHPTRPYLFVATQIHVRVYNLLKQVLTKKLQTNCKWISSLALHHQGDNLLVGSYDSRISWLDLDLSTKPFKTLRYHKKAVRQVAYHRRYPLFASASDDCSVIVSHGMVYNDLLQNPLIVPVKVLRGHKTNDDLGVLDCIFHPTQPWLFSSGADHGIHLYT
ncbi:Ribosome biogenesis protein bop1-B [Nymphon striatum]|nr:Ribosome biogenesis protein bop1-B [Nymphon striatum]